MILENIERIMKEKNISAYKLEKDTGIKQTTVQGWKRGSQPSADKIEILIQYLKVTPNEIFGYNEKRTELTESETELLQYFRLLPPNDQQRELGRLEAKTESIQAQEKLSESRTG